MCSMRKILGLISWPVKMSAAVIEFAKTTLLMQLRDFGKTESVVFSLEWGNLYLPKKKERNCFVSSFAF